MTDPEITFESSEDNNLLDGFLGLCIRHSPKSLVSFTRDKEGVPAGELILQTSDGHKLGYELEGEVLSWAKSIEYEEGEEIAVYTADEITGLLHDFAKKYGFDLHFSWAAPTGEEVSELREAVVARNQIVQEEKLAEMVNVFEDLPTDYIIAWSDDSMGFTRPFGRGFLDIVLYGIQEELNVNWMWTITEHGDTPHATENPYYDAIYLPYNAKCRVAFDEDDNVVQSALYIEGKTLPISPHNAPESSSPYRQWRKKLRNEGREVPYESIVGVWTPDAVNNCLAAWVRKHTGRTDISFVWAPDGEASPMLQKVYERREELGLASGNFLIVAGHEMSPQDAAWFTPERVALWEKQITEWNNDLL